MSSATLYDDAVGAPDSGVRMSNRIVNIAAASGAAYRVELYVQGAQPSHDERRVVLVLPILRRAVHFLGDPDIGHPVQQAVHRDARLRAGQRRTRAGVRPTPERHVLTHIAPVGPKLVRALELARITVARSGKQHDDGPRRNFHVTDRRAGPRQPEVALDRALRPQALLEESGDVCAVVTK